MTDHLRPHDLQVAKDIAELKAYSSQTLELVKELKTSHTTAQGKTDSRLTKLEHGRIRFAGMIVGAVIVVQIALGDMSKALAKFIGVIP